MIFSLEYTLGLDYIVMKGLDVTNTILILPDNVDQTLEFLEGTQAKIEDVKLLNEGPSIPKDFSEKYLRMKEKMVT